MDEACWLEWCPASHIFNFQAEVWWWVPKLYKNHFQFWSEVLWWLFHCTNTIRAYGVQQVYCNVHIIAAMHISRMQRRTMLCHHALPCVSNLWPFIPGLIYIVLSEGLSPSRCHVNHRRCSILMTLPRPAHSRNSIGKWFWPFWPMLCHNPTTIEQPHPDKLCINY